MKKLIVCGALATFALSTPAASAAEFYIVRDATTKKCTVVDSKPTTTTTTVVGNGYKTKVEAESAVKTTKVCTEQQVFGSHLSRNRQRSSSSDPSGEPLSFPVSMRPIDERYGRPLVTQRRPFPSRA